MQKQSVLLIVLVVCLGLFSMSAIAQEGRPLVPNFTLESNQGMDISLEDYAGQVVVLNFWASWCPPCRAEMPDLQKIHDELATTDAAVLLLLNQIDGNQETIATGEKYLADNDYDFVNLYDHGLVGMGIFGLPGLPTTVVIDAEGYMNDFAIGPVTYDRVMQMVEEAQ